MHVQTESVSSQLELLRPHVHNTRVVVCGFTYDNRLFRGELFRVHGDSIEVDDSDIDGPIPISGIREMSHNFVRPREFVH